MRPGTPTARVAHFGRNILNIQKVGLKTKEYMYFRRRNPKLCKQPLGNKGSYACFRRKVEILQLIKIWRIKVTFMNLCPFELKLANIPFFVAHAYLKGLIQILSWKFNFNPRKF